MTPAPERLRRAFLTVLALRWLPIGLFAAVSVLYMTEGGLTLAQVGIGFGVHGLTVALLELPTGGIADAFGRRPVLVLAALLFLSSTLLFLAADTFPVFLASWVVKAVARSLDSGPLEAWYVDEALRREPDRDLEADLSRAGTVLGAAIAVGSLVAGGLGFAAARGWFGDVDPIAIPIVATAVVEAIHVVVTFLLVREHRERSSWPRVRASIAMVPANVASAASSVWRHPGLRWVVAAELVWGAAFNPVESFWQPRTAQLLGGARDDIAVFGILSAAAWAAAAGGASLVPWLVRRLHSRTDLAALVIRAFQGGAVLAMAAAGGVWFFAAAYLATYVTNGANSPPHMALLHRRAGATPRATLLSVNSLCGMGGGFLLGVPIAALAQSSGIPVSLAVAGALLLVTSPLYTLGGRLVAGGDPPATAEAQSRATSIADA